MIRTMCAPLMAVLLSAVACSGTPSCPTGHTYDDTCRVITDALREKCPNSPTIGCNTYSFAKCKNTAGVCAGDVNVCLAKIREPWPKPEEECAAAIAKVYACKWSCAD